jgi:hypothetical protein
MVYLVLIGPHFKVNILSLLRRFIEIIFIMIRVQVEVPSLETSKFSILYFSGSCISINPSFRAYFPQNFWLFSVDFS